MLLAIFELTSWSELFALSGLIATVSGLLGGIGLLWLNSRFASKKLHYREKDLIWIKISETEKQVEKLERESDLAKQPIKTMEAAVGHMSNELAMLNKSITDMDKNVAAAISAIHIRVAVIESTRSKRKT